MVSVCLVNVDYYMSYPIKDLDITYSEFRACEVRQVPVLQIFGSTSTGKKACLHVHGVLPYIYIPYDGKESPQKLSYQIALELDKALNVSLGQSTSTVQHVNNVVLVSGIPIYGYHEKEHQFFKIFFYNPGIVKKACALLENGAILGKPLQPHEAHINYVLQFMIDFNLHGMSYINLSHVKYRFDPQNAKNLENVAGDLILPSSVQKRSVSELEMDALASDILNRHEVVSGKLTVNPGLAALWEEEKQRRRNKDADSQISFCLTQEREKVKSTSTHQYFKKLLYDKLQKCTDEDDSYQSSYPAETPDEVDILSATAVHSTLDTTMSDTVIEATPEKYELDESMLPLYEILFDLKEQNKVEEDSVLSQQVKEPDEAEESSDEELNLTLPLDKESQQSVWNDTFWKDMHLSQLDGNNDSSDSDFDIWSTSDESDVHEAAGVQKIVSEDEEENVDEEKYENALKCVLGSKKTDLYRDESYTPLLENWKKCNVRSYSKTIQRGQYASTKKQIKNEKWNSAVNQYLKSNKNDLFRITNKSGKYTVKSPVKQEIGKRRNIRCYERNTCRVKTKTKVELKKVLSKSLSYKKEVIFNKNTTERVPADSVKIIVSKECNNTEVLEILKDFTSLEEKDQSYNRILPNDKVRNGASRTNMSVLEDKNHNNIQITCAGSNWRVEEIPVEKNYSEIECKRSTTRTKIPTKRLPYRRKRNPKYSRQVDYSTDSDSNIFSLPPRSNGIPQDESSNSLDAYSSNVNCLKKYGKRCRSDTDSDTDNIYSDSKLWSNSTEIKNVEQDRQYEYSHIVPTYSYKYKTGENTLNVLYKRTLSNREDTNYANTEILDASKVHITRPSADGADQCLKPDNSVQVLKPGRSILKINKCKKAYEGEKVVVLSDIRCRSKNNSIVSWNFDKDNSVIVDVKDCDKNLTEEATDSFDDDSFNPCTTLENISENSFDLNQEIDGVLDNYSENTPINSWLAKNEGLPENPSPTNVILKDVTLGSDCNPMYYEIEELCSTDLNKLKPKSSFNLEDNDEKKSNKFRNLESPLDGSFHLDFDVGMNVCVPMSSILQDVSTQTNGQKVKKRDALDDSSTLLSIAQETEHIQLALAHNYCVSKTQNISSNKTRVNSNKLIDGKQSLLSSYLMDNKLLSHTNGKKVYHRSSKSDNFHTETNVKIVRQSQTHLEQQVVKSNKFIRRGNNYSKLAHKGYCEQVTNVHTEEASETTQVFGDTKNVTKQNTKVLAQKKVAEILKEYRNNKFIKPSTHHRTQKAQKNHAPPRKRMKKEKPETPVRSESDLTEEKINSIIQREKQAEEERNKKFGSPENNSKKRQKYKVDTIKSLMDLEVERQMKVDAPEKKQEIKIFPKIAIGNGTGVNTFLYTLSGNLVKVLDTWKPNIVLNGGIPVNNFILQPQTNNVVLTPSVALSTTQLVTSNNLASTNHIQLASIVNGEAKTEYEKSNRICGLILTKTLTPNAALCSNNEKNSVNNTAGATKLENISLNKILQYEPSNENIPENSICEEKLENKPEMIETEGNHTNELSRKTIQCDTLHVSEITTKNTHFAPLPSKDESLDELSEQTKHIETNKAVQKIIENLDKQDSYFKSDCTRKAELKKLNPITNIHETESDDSTMSDKSLITCSSEKVRVLKANSYDQNISDFEKSNITQSIDANNFTNTIVNMLLPDSISSGSVDSDETPLDYLDHIDEPESIRTPPRKSYPKKGTQENVSLTNSLLEKLPIDMYLDCIDNSENNDIENTCMESITPSASKEKRMDLVQTNTSFKASETVPIKNHCESIDGTIEIIEIDNTKATSVQLSGGCSNDTTDRNSESINTIPSDCSKMIDDDKNTNRNTSTPTENSTNQEKADLAKDVDITDIKLIKTDTVLENVICEMQGELNTTISKSDSFNDDQTTCIQFDAISKENTEKETEGEIKSKLDPADAEKNSKTKSDNLRKDKNKNTHFPGNRLNRHSSYDKGKITNRREFKKSGLVKSVIRKSKLRLENGWHSRRCVKKIESKPKTEARLKKLTKRKKYRHKLKIQHRLNCRKNRLRKKSETTIEIEAIASNLMNLSMKEHEEINAESSRNDNLDKKIDEMKDVLTNDIISLNPLDIKQTKIKNQQLSQIDTIVPQHSDMGPLEKATTELSCITMHTDNKIENSREEIAIDDHLDIPKTSPNSELVAADVAKNSTIENDYKIVNVCGIENESEIRKENISKRENSILLDTMIDVDANKIKTKTHEKINGVCRLNISSQDKPLDESFSPNMDSDNVLIKTVKDMNLKHCNLSEVPDKIPHESISKNVITLEQACTEFLNGNYESIKKIVKNNSNGHLQNVLDLKSEKIIEIIQNGDISKCNDISSSPEIRRVLDTLVKMKNGVVALREPKREIPITIPTDGPNDSSSESDTSKENPFRNSKNRKKKQTEVQQLHDSLSLPPVYGLRKNRAIRFVPGPVRRRTSRNSDGDDVQKSKKLMVLIPPREIKICEEFNPSENASKSCKKVGESHGIDENMQIQIKNEERIFSKSATPKPGRRTKEVVPKKSRAGSPALSTSSKDSNVSDIHAKDGSKTKRSRSNSRTYRNISQKELFEIREAVKELYIEPLKDADFSNRRITRSRSRSCSRTRELPPDSYTMPLNDTLSNYPNTRSRSRSCSRQRSVSIERELPEEVNKKSRKNNDRSSQSTRSRSISRSLAANKKEKEFEDSKRNTRSRSLSRAKSIERKPKPVLDNFEPYNTRTRAKSCSRRNSTESKKDNVCERVYMTRSRSRSSSRCKLTDNKFLESSPKSNRRSSYKGKLNTDVKSRSYPKTRSASSSRCSPLNVLPKENIDIDAQSCISNISSDSNISRTGSIRSYTPKKRASRSRSTRSRSVCKQPEQIVSEIKLNEHINSIESLNILNKRSCFKPMLLENIYSPDLFEEIDHEFNDYNPHIDSNERNTPDVFSVHKTENKISVIKTRRKSALCQINEAQNHKTIIEKPNGNHSNFDKCSNTKPTDKTRRKSYTALEITKDIKPPSEKHENHTRIPVPAKVNSRRKSVSKNSASVKEVSEKIENIDVLKTLNECDIQCSNSSEEFVTPKTSTEKLVSSAGKHTSPRRPRRKIVQPSKYSPLNVIVTSPKKNHKVAGKEDEIGNKMPSFNASKIPQRLDTEEETPKSVQNICSDVGELEPIQMLEYQREEKRTMDNENKIKTIQTRLKDKEFNCDNLKESANNVEDSDKGFSNKINSIKKNLYFSTGDNSADKTMVEEKKVCTYKQSAKVRKPRRLSKNSEQIYRSKEDKFLEELNQEYSKPVNNLTIKPNGDYVYNLRIKNRNISNPVSDESINVSVSVKSSEIQKLTVAQQYDIEHNFFPKPCCSKMTDNEMNEAWNDKLLGSSFANLVKDPSFITQQIEEYKNYDVKNVNTQTPKKVCDQKPTEYQIEMPKTVETTNFEVKQNTTPNTSFEFNFKIDYDKLDFSSLVKNPDFISKQIEEYKNYNQVDLGTNTEQESSQKFIYTEETSSDDSSIVFSSNSPKDVDETPIEATKPDVKKNQVTTKTKSNVFKPQCDAPTFHEVKSTLLEYGIPENRFEQPFYSDYMDVTGKMDVGCNVLKIPSKTVADLEEFQTCTDFGGLDAWRKNLFHESAAFGGKNNLKKTLAGFSESVITPSNFAPTREEVKEWVKSKVKDDKKIEVMDEKIEKPRMRIPMSPDGNESLDESLTLSPCSPLDNSFRDATLVKINPDTEVVTEVDVNSTTPTLSPSLIRRGIKKKKGSLQRKVLFQQSGLSKKLSNCGNEIIDLDEDKEKSQESDDLKLNPLGSFESVSSVITSDLIIPDSQADTTPDTKSLDYSRLKPSDLNLSDSSGGNNHSRQITGVTLNNTHGFKMSYENLQDAKALVVSQNLTVMVVEVHTQARGDLHPNPEHDSIRAIFYSVLYDIKGDSKQEITGVIAVDTLPGSPNPKGLPRPSILEGTGIECDITYAKSEMELMDEFVKLVRKWDPDIFTGYEIEMFSWGYLIERGYILSMNLPILLSRLNPEVVKQKLPDEKDSNYDLKIPGRIILGTWRLLRHEIALQSYTFENIMYHILHERVPLFSYKDLSFWWEHRSNVFRSITAKYYIVRVEGILKILDQLDLIGRTSELAKLFGIQFYEVLSRGSQFRVESLMLRLAKPQNYIPVSPSVQQRAKMRAPEFLPLILEPESRLYTDPVIVLDFQSLYPSIIIAHNYCFSTCIGRVEKLGNSQPFEFGATQLKIPPQKLKKLQHKINFAPCGVGFVKPEIRKGILPRMLQEILETRLMVKNSMKENKDNKLLQRVLHSRQLGLKLIANVTYGYTAANFSGRMPCIEVGDSVVSKGRETLERAIKLIESNKDWRVRVVYGDTDSLFVLAAGRTREQAFQIGEEIAEAVTKDNPPPVKLKLEKIFQPCILQTKKRYVGYMYESPDQETAEYCAKGIETVRRDGCPAVAKILEKCLRMLFETCDVSLIKKYVIRQFGKILMGRASIQDLIFAKEYRGANGYRPGACVPALELAKKWKSTDVRKEPRRGQRVPYVIVNGPPGLPLIKLVRSPYELLADPGLRPNALYYITKVIIPPVNRCFSLFGADLNIWFNEMPRKQVFSLPTEVVLANNKKSTISQYFATVNCAVCGNQTRKGLCEVCLTKPQSSLVALNYKLLDWERNYTEVVKICQCCCGRLQYTDCISLDCPVMYRLNQTKLDSNQSFFVRELLANF